MINNTINNYYYKKLDKPYNKEYVFGENKIKVKHKYLIVFFDIEYNKNNTIKNSIQELLIYIEKDNDIQIKPSEKVLNMLRNVVKNSDSYIDIITRYYASATTK